MSKHKESGRPGKKNSGKNEAEIPLPNVDGKKIRNKKEKKFIPLTQEEEDKALAQLENEGKDIIKEGEKALAKAKGVGGEPETVAELEEEVTAIAEEAETIVVEAKDKVASLKDLSAKVNEELKNQPKFVDAETEKNIAKEKERLELEKELEEINEQIKETELFEKETKEHLAETEKEQVKENIDTEKEEETQADEEKEEPKNPSPEPGKELLKIEPTEEEKLKEWRETIQKNIIAEIDEKNELRMREGKPAFTTEEKDKMVLDRLIEERDIFNGKKKESSGLIKIVKNCLKKSEEWWLDTDKHKVAKAGLNAGLTVLGTYLTGYLNEGILARGAFRAISAVATTGIITSESGQKKMAEILKFGSKLNEYVNSMFKDAGLNEKQERIARMITKGGFIVLGAGTIASGLVATGLASAPTLAIGAIGAGVRYGITKGKDYLLTIIDNKNKELYQKLGNDFDITKFEKTSDKEIENTIKEIRDNNAIKRILKWDASILGIGTSVATADLLLLSMQNNTDVLHNPSKTETATPAPAPTTSDSLTANQKYEHFLNGELGEKKDSLVSDTIPSSDKFEEVDTKKDTISSTLNKTGNEENITDDKPEKVRENQEQPSSKPTDKTTDVEKKNVNVKKGGTQVNDETEKTKETIVTKKTNTQLEDAKKIGLNESAIIHKDEGITDAFAKQLRANPDLAEKLGFEGSLEDKHTMAEFTKKLAIDLGYIDEKGNEIRVSGIDKTAYVLGVDENNKPTVSESEWSKMPDGTHGWMGIEDHKNGTIFEGKDHNNYEYVDDKNKPSGEPKTDNDGPTRASENSGPVFRTNIPDDSGPSPKDTTVAPETIEKPEPETATNIPSLEKYTYENVSKSPLWETLNKENAYDFLSKTKYTPEEEKIRTLLRIELTKARKVDEDIIAYMRAHPDFKIYETLAVAHNISHNGYTIDDQGVLYSPEEMKEHVALIIKQGNAYNNLVSEIFQKKGGFFSSGGMDKKLWENTGSQNMIAFTDRGEFADGLKPAEQNLLKTIKIIQERLSLYEDRPMPKNDENVKNYLKRLINFSVEKNKTNIQSAIFDAKRTN